MITRRFLGLSILALALLHVPTLAGPANAQVAGKPPEPSLAKVMPFAAGALVGGATAFFILPLIVPSLASGAATVGPAVGTPALGAIGAVIGGAVGYVWYR